MSKYLNIIRENVRPSEHPDASSFSDATRDRMDKIVAARRKRRADANDPKVQKAKRAADFFSKSVIRREEYDLGEAKDEEYSMARRQLDTATDAIQKLKKRLKGEGELEAWVQAKLTKSADYLRGVSDYMNSRESEVTEETMTKADIKREEQLKQKYDDSEMKANFIKQYGAEKGKSVYFAYIRKKAMAEDFEIEEEYKELPRKKMLTRAGKHNFYAGWVQGEWETNRFNKGKKRNRTKEMVSDATGKANKIYDTVISHDPEAAKAKSKYKPVKESYEYDELLDEAKLSRTERRARNAGRRGYDKTGRRTPRGAIHAFDVDETIFSHGVKGKPNVQVHVNDPSGKRVQSLTNQEFNTHKLPKGHSYDFGEFRSAQKFAQTTSPNKSVIKKIKKLQRRGKRVQLITARDKFDNPEAFRQHFVRHGINVKPGDIHYTGGMKGSDVGQKKVAVGKGLAKMHGASSIHMYDDAAKVHKAFEAEKGKSRRLKIKTHLAKPNKRGEVMLRSYQATKEDFELWIENLLDEGYDLSDFTVDELYETFEYVLDEAITAVGASGGDRPFNKHPRKKMMPNMTKPVTRFTDTTPRVKPVTRDTDTTPKIKPMFKGPNFRTKKDYKEELELTPYEYWKSFIFEDEDMVDEYEVEENELDEEIELTPYDVWKLYCSERMSNEV